MLLSQVIHLENDIFKSNTRTTLSQDSGKWASTNSDIIQV